MKAYRDLAAPLEAHDIVLDRVRLSFGADGVLRNPDEEQLATMTASPMRRARFVEVAPPAPPPPPVAEESVAPAKAELPAPVGKAGKKAPAATPAPDEGAGK